MQSIVLLASLTVVYTVAFAATSYKKPNDCKRCPEGQKQICVPNSTFKEDCNTCICNECGTAAGCTKIACPHQVCIANKTFMEDCNICACNEDGTGAICTLLACPIVPITNNGT